MKEYLLKAIDLFTSRFPAASITISSVNLIYASDYQSYHISTFDGWYIVDLRDNSAEEVDFPWDYYNN